MPDQSTSNTGNKDKAFLDAKKVDIKEAVSGGLTRDEMVFGKAPEKSNDEKITEVAKLRVQYEKMKEKIFEDSLKMRFELSNAISNDLLEENK